jgi:hypothetical protein
VITPPRPVRLRKPRSILHGRVQSRLGWAAPRTGLGGGSPLWIAAAVGVPGILLGELATQSPEAGIAVGLLAAAACLLVAVPARLAIASLIVYLPMEGWLLGYAPGSASSVLRYAPEGLCILALCVVAAGYRSSNLGRWNSILPMLGATVACWLIGAVAADESASQAVIGVRAELRWVPLCLLVALSRDVTRDARVYARGIVAAASVQAFVAVAELTVGQPARAFFAPHYNIVLGGVTVSSSTTFRPDSISGTLDNYNSLGTWLLMGWIVAVLAGTKGLGVSRWVVWLTGIGFPAIIVLAGSREALIALAVAAVAIGGIRYRFPVFRAVAVVGLIGAVSYPILTNSAATNGANRTDLRTRFEVLLNPATYSPTSSSNFRLALLASSERLTFSHSPLLGFGIGSVVDPRSLASGTNPFYLTSEGQQAIKFGYLYDGNWALLLTETGIVGLALLTLLLGSIARVAWRARAGWVGSSVVVLTACIIVLGFFESILQTDASAVYWALIGCVLAVVADRRVGAGLGDSARKS